MVTWFTEANLNNADLSGSELTAITTDNYGASTIDFTETTLIDFTETTLIDFTETTLANADLSGSKLSADSIIGLAPSAPPPPSPPSPSPPPWHRRWRRRR